MGGEGEIGEIVYAVTTWLLPVLFAITLHEAAHGYVAWKLGDDTAYRLGRVSFNPLRHIDRFGTIILPGLLLLMRAPFLFGWAKPVPVNPNNFRRPGFADFMVSFAGPASNFTIALILFFTAKLLAAIHPELLYTKQEILINFQLYILPRSTLLADVFIYVITINCALACFNLIPLYPLDGHHMLREILPSHLRHRFMGWQFQYGGYCLIALIAGPYFLNTPSPIGRGIFWLFQTLQNYKFGLIA